MVVFSILAPLTKPQEYWGQKSPSERLVSNSDTVVSQRNKGMKLSSCHRSLLVLCCFQQYHHHLHRVCCDPPAPTWPFLFLLVMILVIFPAWTPLPGQMHLPNPCIPISLWGLTDPSENCDPAAPHTQRQPNLPWLLKPDTWYNQAGLYGAFPGQTFSPISSAVAPL